MGGLFFMLVLLLIVGAPALMVVGTPRLIARLVTACVVLAMGLLWLDEHVATIAPYDDDGPFYGFAQGIFWLMFWTTAIAVVIRSLSLLENDPENPRAQIDRFWPIPLGILLAALFLHWLSNRLAGAQPAALIHVIALLIGIVAGGIFGLLAWRFKKRAWLPHCFLSSFGLAFAAMIVGDAAKGFSLWSEANELADSNPHCIMTYGGFRHQRVATNGWELSPLVNRHYGTWAASKHPVLVYSDDKGLHQIRWINGHSSWGELGDPPCKPDEN